MSARRKLLIFVVPIVVGSLAYVSSALATPNPPPPPSDNTIFGSLSSDKAGDTTMVIFDTVTKEKVKVQRDLMDQIASGLNRERPDGAHTIFTVSGGQLVASFYADERSKTPGVDGEPVETVTIGGEPISTASAPISAAILAP